MKKVYFYFGIALAAFLSSCTDDSLNNGVKNPVHTGDEILFGSTLSDNADMIEGTAESRTVYGDRTPTGVPVYWEKDGTDTIAIYCLQSSQPANHLVRYKVVPELDAEGNPTETAANVTKVNTAEAGLQWGNPDTEHRFYAFYPASAVKGSTEENTTGQITANLPVTQQVQEWRTVEAGAEGSIQGKKTYFGLPNMDYAYMYAYNAVTPSQVKDGSLIDLHFKNLVTVLDITVQGPQSGTATITNINVDAIEGETPILTGDFTCNIRNASTGTGDGITATCTPVGSFNEERGRISIPCYDKKTGQFIQLGPDELLNVKAYIIPQDLENTVHQHTLRITVSMLNGAPCRKTLNQADVTPHKINRVILPKLEVGGTNYWMSSLDPDIYVSELSIPGSKFSVLTKENNAGYVYQNATIQQQFTDGVRAFILQTATIGANTDNNSSEPNRDNEFTYDGFYVVSETKDNKIKTLAESLKEIASYLAACPEGKQNEFAVVMLTFAFGDYDYGAGYDGWITGWHWIRQPENQEQFWITKLRDEINAIKGDPQYRIYTGEITPNTTIADVAGKIILKANYNTENMINSYGDTTAPVMFTYWGGPYGPKNSDNVTYYQDTYDGMPMDWGVPKWYLNSQGDLRWYYQEVTTVGNGAEASVSDKNKFVSTLFQKSVDLYKNDTSHKTWFMNDLGGRYTDSGNIGNRENGMTALAEDMNQKGVEELQDRAENAGLGLVFMNFADKQSDSGAKYKSDWLIQTLIDNNFKFALRKKEASATDATRTYNSSYKAGGNAIGWDK